MIRPPICRLLFAVSVSLLSCLLYTLPPPPPPSYCAIYSLTVRSYFHGCFFFFCLTHVFINNVIVYLSMTGDIFQYPGGIAVGAAARQPVGDLRVRDGRDRGHHTAIRQTSVSEVNTQ